MTCNRQLSKNSASDPCCDATIDNQKKAFPVHIDLQPLQPSQRLFATAYSIMRTSPRPVRSPKPSVRFCDFRAGAPVGQRPRPFNYCDFFKTMAVWKGAHKRFPQALGYAVLIKNRAHIRKRNRNYKKIHEKPSPNKRISQVARPWALG